MQFSAANLAIESVKYYSSLAFVLLAAGCAGYWGRRPLDQATPVVKPDNPVWIWRGATVEKWHDVVITLDSVSGIPFNQSLKCTGCRRSIPRAEVDSMKLGYKTFDEKLIEGVGGVAASLALLGLLCAVVDPHHHSHDSPCGGPSDP